MEAFSLKLFALFCMPVGLDEFPAVIPAAENERCSGDAEIWRSVISEESTVSKSANVFAKKHGINKVQFAPNCSMDVDAALALGF